MPEILSATAARKQLFSLLQEIKETEQTVVLTERGKPSAVMMSYDLYERWQATIKMLENNSLYESMTHAEADYIAGLHETLDSLFEKQGYIAADNIAAYYDKNHATTNHTRAQKNRKRPKAGTSDS